MLLVGAPRALYSGRQEGGVYTCTLEHGATCEMDPLFNSRESRDLLGLLSPDNSSFDGQLLGFTVRSFDKNIAVCAPLYITSGGVSGRCFTIPRDFTNSTVPLQISSTNVIFNIALGGIDINMLEYGNNMESIVIGSVLSGGTDLVHPGQVYSVEEVEQIIVSETVLILQSQFSSESVNPDVDELRGYHIETGHFCQNISMNITELFSSAPRANRHIGSVIIYMYTPEGSTFDKKIELEDNQPDSYFGYDFALLDLQTGGYHSVVVGCPMCERDRGMVFVYIHSGIFSDPIRKKQMIPSPDIQRGLFGLAVENIGDIDQDGYEDVAISAPYVDDGHGVVYIFRGSSDGLISDDYQIIRGKPRNKFGFGKELTAGLDIDENGYPDLTIGDLSNEEIYTIRSSPVVNVDISILEQSIDVDYFDRNCVVRGVPLVCFNITPCFKFSTVRGTVDKFAIRYTLIVDEVIRRVGLLDSITENNQTNQVTDEIVINSGLDKTCTSTKTFVLQPDFTDTAPFPLRLTITSADVPLELPSNDSERFGGPLHPVLSRASDGSSFEQTIIPVFVINCDGGTSSDCDPVYRIEADLDNDVMSVPLAAGFQFGYRIALTNTIDDSLAATFIIDHPLGIQLSSFKPITDFAVSICSSLNPQKISCDLKNPITIDEEVIFEIFFRPDVNRISFDLQTLTFDFSVMDERHEEPLGQSLTYSVPATSIANYNILSSFGITEVTATRILPFVNVSAASLDTLGPTVNYQVTLSNTGSDDTHSPIPTTHLNIIWPASITLSGQIKQPLLVPTRIAVVGTNEFTCSERGAIPTDLLNSGQQALNLNELSEDVPTEPYCPKNVTCGVIQCKITRLSPQLSGNASTAPIQITVFSNLWSQSVREQFNITVYALVESVTEYPIIEESSVLESSSTITLIPAVQETQTSCFQIWVIVVAVVCGLLVGFFLILALGLCGFFGRGYYKNKQKEELDKRWRDLQEVDGSLGMRVIPPPGSEYLSGVNEPDDKDQEAEDELKEFNDVTMPHTFAPYQEEGEITGDPLGEITGDPFAELPSTLEVAPEPKTDDVETEI